MRSTEPSRGGGGVRAALSQLLGVWGLNKQVQRQVILARAHALWQHAPPSQLDLDKSAFRRHLDVELSAEATEEACLRLCNLGNVLHVLALGPKNEAAVQQSVSRPYSAVMRARLTRVLDAEQEREGRDRVRLAGQGSVTRLD